MAFSSVANSALGEFQVRQNRGKPFEWVFQRATRKVKTNNHHSWRIRSVVLPSALVLIPGMQAVVSKANT